MRGGWGRKQLKMLLACALVGFGLNATKCEPQTAPPGIFTQQSSVDCSDEANADMAACRQVSPPEGGIVGQIPPGASQPQTYSDTERLYVDRPSGSFSRQGDGARATINRGSLEPLTEFQKLIRASTQQLLPVYGASLFQTAQPSTFAPVDQVPVTPDYTVGPGDEVLLRVWGQLTLNARLTVDRGGAIYIPRVGQVQVTGLPYGKLESVLRAAIGRLYRNFDLNVNLGQLRSIQVFVVGYARRPGSYTISSLSTLVNAVFASGGPGSEGSLRDIELKRDGRVLTTLDLYDLLMNGDTTRDAALQSGDVIYFAPVGPQIAIAGGVHMPGIYELAAAQRSKGATVSQGIALAGGLSETAAVDHASIERIEDRTARETLDIKLDAAGMTTELHGGDLLHVRSLIPRFEKTVTLRGNVANPGRYPWYPGMRVRDLIPERDALLTRDYWRNKSAQGSFGPEIYSPLDRDDLQGRQSREQWGSGLAQGSSRERNGSGADRYSGSHSGQQARTEGELSSTPDSSGEQGGSVSNRDLLYGSDRQPGDPLPDRGDVSTQFDGASERDQKALQENGTRAGTGAVGESLQQSGQFPRKNAVERSAADIDWAYAAIERLNAQDLTTNILAFNLGAVVLHGNEEQNLQLQPGDTITVFSKADIHVAQEQQVKFVRLEGEFNASGEYQVHPGETLRQLVKRVGGTTAAGYLYGSVFTRVSTREQQQQQLEEFANSLQRQIEVEGASRAASVVNASEAAAAGNSTQSQQSLVTSLRKLRATGRIVLRIPPDAVDAEALPDMALEDGDRFVVPSRPSSVNVVGAVYDQNSFLYTRNRLLGDYLHEAGGVNRDGDKRHAFLIRADGSVVSRTTSVNTIWENNFTRVAMHPGDTLVVPDNINKSTLLRGLTDWSQVFGQFALGAAAINVIR